LTTSSAAAAAPTPDSLRSFSKRFDFSKKSISVTNFISRTKRFQ
jgi:hypothetical protein